MDLPDPQNPDLFRPRPAPVEAADPGDLQLECRELRTLFHATLVGLIVLCLAVDWFMGKAWRLERQKITERQLRYAEYEADFRRNRDLEIRRFMDELHKYAATHPEFRANVLDRYRVVLAQYFNSGVAMSKPPPIPSIPAGTNAGAGRPPGR